MMVSKKNLKKKKANENLTRHQGTNDEEKGVVNGIALRETLEEIILGDQSASENSCMILMCLCP